jgi:hypothetical protein
LQDLEPVASDFGEPGVDEEVDACAGQRSFGRARSREDVGGVRVGEERGDNAGFSDDLAIEVYRGDEAALDTCQYY